MNLGSKRPCLTLSLFTGLSQARALLEELLGTRQQLVKRALRRPLVEMPSGRLAAIAGRTVEVWRVRYIAGIIMQHESAQVVHVAGASAHVESSHACRFKVATPNTAGMLQVEAPTSGNQAAH